MSSTADRIEALSSEGLSEQASPTFVTIGGSVGRSCCMLIAMKPRAANTFARKLYWVNLTVLP